jgi:hypothetical protein
MSTGSTVEIARNLSGSGPGAVELVSPALPGEERDHLAGHQVPPAVRRPDPTLAGEDDYELLVAEVVAETHPGTSQRLMPRRSDPARPPRVRYRPPKPGGGPWLRPALTSNSCE